MRDLARPLKLIARMPFVRMVALSGSLAHLNASRGADLDLFVITKSNRAWSVVVTLIAVARLVGWRRQLCVNYVVTERQLTVEPQDLFTANQIIHLRPLVGDSVYRKFLAANAFVPDFYPNFAPRACAWRDEDRYLSRWLERILDWTVAPIYERCCRAIYGWHLRRRAASWLSRDQVRLEPDCLKLHTSSHRQSVMERFAIGMAEAERVTPAAAVRARAAR
jgi:hypothetical protein